jgi:hypothetical protein
MKQVMMVHDDVHEQTKELYIYKNDNSPYKT